MLIREQANEIRDLQDQLNIAMTFYSFPRKYLSLLTCFDNHAKTKINCPVALLPSVQLNTN